MKLPLFLEKYIDSSRFADEASLDEWIIQNFRREEIKKKTSIFLEGETNTRHYFIQKGMLRLYVIDPAGKEFNVLFACEGEIIGDLSTPKETMFYLDTVEDSVLYSIKESQLESMMTTYFQKETTTSELFRRSYLHLQRRFVAILTQSAEDNFLKLRQKSPELIQRLPQYHIASYLGVSAEFLSKIIARTTKR